MKASCGLALEAAIDHAIDLKVQSIPICVQKHTETFDLETSNV